ncbi:MAG: hypothetical protein A2V66_03615 [Ignavibacteria bacterium RBG_13_36_8]|nr:MAG: hypothetical protein A2V66_03615 [Ignavibacteria bacterium RBG_13_36_8]
MSEQINIVDVHFLSEFFGMDVRTIQNWADKDKTYPNMPRLKKGEYDFLKCVKWRLQFLERENKKIKAAGEEKLVDIELQKEIKKDKLEDIKLKKELQQLVDRKMTLIAISNVFKIINHYMESCRHELKRDTAGKSGAGLEKTIDASIDEMKSNVHKLNVEKLLIDEEKLIEGEI